MATSSHSGRAGTSSAALARIALLLAVLALVLLGLVMVYSASMVEAITDGDSPASYVIDQLLFVAAGGLLMVALWKLVPFQVWRGPLTWVVLAVAAALLVLTAVVGTESLGARRWLSLGPVSMQPSEFAKIAFVLAGAKVLDSFRQRRISVVVFMVQGLLCVMVPIMFMYQTQSDLGTTVICLVGVMALLWIGEAPMGVMLGIVAVVAVGVAVAVFGTDYRADRLIFLNPWDDGEGGYGDGWQLIRSFYAFAQGGILGVGVGNSSEKYLYLPEAETDFIYAVIGEELGLLGALAVILLFLLMLYAGLRIAWAAQDNFAAMVAGSLVIMIVFQAFLNIGCVIGVLPTTGKPLPLISSGGSSMIATLMMIGLVLAVSEESSRRSVYERRRDDLRIVRATDAGARVQARPGGRGGRASA